MFSGEDEKTALEHISRFTVQCGEYSNNGNGKLRMFPNSLTGQAFTWYSVLLANFIEFWEEMEEKFQSHFTRSNIGVSMADLARLKQKPYESEEQFIMRFKRIKTRCHISLPEAEYVKIAIDGLNFELRKKFEGITFIDLFELSERASRFEGLLKEENQRKNSSYRTYYQDPNYEIDLAEYVGRGPFVCDALHKKQIQTKESNKPASPLKAYSFDVKKADEIFDILYKANQLKIIGRHRFPSKEELKGRDYCKWHSTYTHATKSGVTFRNVVQNKIDRNILKFPETPQENMAVDADPFPFVDVNTTSVDLSSLMPHRNLYVKNNKVKVNSLQAFGPQERQLVREMSSLKIEKSATTRQSSSAKISGRRLSIQDNNVYADKEKNVARPTEQPIISYKEMLRKESLKINSESDEDNTICERCSHILAKCFSRLKKEDDYKPPKVEQPKLVPKSIENSRSEPRSAP
jgi:hypothetical protein